MPIYQALVYGIIQGLAEFLPISSSAHLTIAPWLFGWTDPGLEFDVALHFGTLVAVLWYFRAEWARLLAAVLEIVGQRRAEAPEQRRVIYLIIATIPGAIAGKLLERQAESTFRDPRLIAVMLMLMGVVLWAADRFARQDRPLRAMNWVDALLFGVAQIFALIPGVSRSGSTMSTGRLLRFDREGAAAFSFLMSMPIIAGATLLKVPHLLRAHGLGAPLAVALLASAISGWFAIAVVLRWLTRHSFGVFALYRVVAGAAVLALAYARLHG